MPDVRDVARLARVSPSTVSNVVRGRDVVTRETRERVLAAISELDYVPNTLARSFRGKGNTTLGYVVPDAANPFYAEVFKGLLAEAQAHGLTAMVAESGYSLAHEGSAVEHFAGMQAVGVVLVSASWDLGHIRRVCDQRCPVILADTADPAWGLTCVVSDNRGGAYQAVSHLARRGHRQIAFVGEPALLPVCQHRYQGYVAALADHGLPLDEALVAFDEGLRQHKLEWGHQVGRRLLSGPPQGSEHRPTAVFAAGDLMAMGVMRAAAECGLSVPGDLAVVGFDDIEMSAYSWPPLTTVRQERHELGRSAVAGLLAEAGGGAPGSSHVLETRLVIRQSS